jgi:hypothetical protein
LNLPHPFMSSNSDFPMMQPGMDKTGPVPVKAPSESMPVEQLVQQQRQGQASPTATLATPGLTNPGVPPPPAAPAAGTGK